MEEIAPVTRTIKKVESEKGTRFHCFGPHNPHYYMKNGVLRPIDVLAVSKDQITTGKQLADIRGSHVVSVGLNKADTYEKCIGFRRDDKQDGSEQFEITFLGATYNDIAYSSDSSVKAVIAPLTNRIGNLHVYSDRHRTRLALPATKSVSKFRIQFKIHTVGLTAKQVGEDFHFVNAKGQFRFGLKKPSILGSDYQPYKVLVEEQESFPYVDAVAHYLEDLGNGEYLYTKESTDLFKGMPDAYLIDAETVYSGTNDGVVFAIGASANWSAARDATSGTARTSNTSYAAVHASRGNMTTPARVCRSFFMFDTSALSGHVTSAAFLLRIQSVENSPTICAQEGTQGDSLDNEDFDAFTGDSVGTVAAGTGYKTITFDETGKAMVNIGGTTYVCAREYSHDYENSAPSTNTAYGATIYFADYEGTDYDPYLSLELSQFTPRIIMVC